MSIIKQRKEELEREIDKLKQYIDLRKEEYDFKREIKQAITDLKIKEAELKGITFAQADEIKWLEEQVRVIDNCVNKPEFADLKKDIQDRINELK